MQHVRLQCIRYVFARVEPAWMSRDAQRQRVKRTTMKRTYDDDDDDETEAKEEEETRKIDKQEI